MSELLPEPDRIIYDEMMSHPALFSHPHPQKIAIIGDQHHQILREILKHNMVTDIWQITLDKITDHHDTRIKYYSGKANEWMTAVEPYSLDVIIVAENSAPEQIAYYYDALHSDGIFILHSESTFDVAILASTQKNLFSAGFRDAQPLSFPQPHSSPAWRSIFIAKKQGVLRKIREKDIFNKTFATHYYNFDMHKAALAMPEFMREKLATY